MGRNKPDFESAFDSNGQFKDLIEDAPAVTPEGWSHDTSLMPKWYHVSPKSNRAAIEKHGLRANDHFERYGLSDAEKRRRGRGEIKVGVFVSRQPDKDYGDDVYQVDAVQGTKVMHNTGDSYFPKSVPAKSVKRVGHVTADGEIHMHPEEQCNG